MVRVEEENRGVVADKHKETMYDNWVKKQKNKEAIVTFRCLALMMQTKAPC